TIDGRDDHVLEFEPGDGFRDVLRLLRVEWLRQSSTDVAEGASARARVAHDHHGRVLLAPALADVGAACLLADGVQIVLPHDALRLAIDWRAGRLDASPARLAEDRAVGLQRLLGM